MESHVNLHATKPLAGKTGDDIRRKAKGDSLSPAGRMPKHECGCPGSKTVDFREHKSGETAGPGVNPVRDNERFANKDGGIVPLSDSMDSNRRQESAAFSNGVKLESELRTWPIQLHLVNPSAPYFQDSDIVISADCAAFAYADFHRKFIKGKVPIIFCPKLDNSREDYVEKLAEIFKNNTVKSVSIVHMEVPCCFGVEDIVSEAIIASGKNIVLKEYTVSLQGELV